MDDNEKFEKIHKILEFIAVGDVLDSRKTAPKAQWRYWEFKHIEFNEYIIGGLFEILQKDGIVHILGDGVAHVDQDKAKAAYYLKSYLPKSKSWTDKFWTYVSNGNNLAGLIVSIIVLGGFIWGSILFLKSCGTNESDPESQKTTDTIPEVNRKQIQTLQDSTNQLASDTLKTDPADSSKAN